MKITDERPTTTKKKYGELNCGDVFMINGFIIMKTDVKDTTYARGINLRTGTWVSIGGNESVEPLDAELIIMGVSE